MRFRHKETNCKERLDKLEAQVLDMRQELTQVLTRLHNMEQVTIETRLWLPKLETQLRQEISTLARTLQFR